MVWYYKFRAFVVTWLLRLLPKQPQVVFQGPGSSLALCRQLPVLGIGRVLIVTDAYLAGAGVLDGIKSALEELDVAFDVYDGVQPDPAFDQVREGVALALEQGSEAVLAVGGGSVMDAAKVIAMIVRNPGELADFDGIQKFGQPGVPTFAVPSTAGTGSEVTGVAMITDPASHRKVPVIDSKMIPGFVALDAEITRGMPPAVTAATGMDALTHAVESFLSTASTPSTERHARTAVRLIFRYLERAWANGDDIEARDGMVLAAYYAGTAFGSTSVGYVHGIAHQFGRLCGTPHGNANAMVLPEVLGAYGEVVHARLAELAAEVGVGNQGDPPANRAVAFIRAIAELRERMEMPLAPRGLKPEHVSDVVQAAISEAGSLYPVMRYLSADELRMIVENKLAA